jgi:carbon storage regulator
VLVLTRRAGESIVIGDDVRVVVLDSRGETVRLGIEAPRSVQVHRAEVYAEVQAANAAALASGDLGPLADRLARAARPRVAAGAAGRRGASRDAVPARARRMVTMSEGDQRLEQVGERIDEARDAAEHAEPDLLPQEASPADGTFQPSGDDRQAGENPSEGPARDAAGDLDDD